MYEMYIVYIYYPALIEVSPHRHLRPRRGWDRPVLNLEVPASQHSPINIPAYLVYSGERDVECTLFYPGTSNQPRSPIESTMPTSTGAWTSSGTTSLDPRCHAYRARSQPWPDRDPSYKGAPSAVHVLLEQLENVQSWRETCAGCQMRGSELIISFADARI